MKKIHIPQKAIRNLRPLHLQLPIQLAPHSSKEFALTQLRAEEINYPINIAEEVLQNFVRVLGMEFLNEAPPAGQVCFAQSNEVRDDFKTYFTPIDLLAYLNALKEVASLRKPTCVLAYPSDARQFWKNVQKSY